MHLEISVQRSELSVFETQYGVDVIGNVLQSQVHDVCRPFPLSPPLLSNQWYLLSHQAAMNIGHDGLVTLRYKVLMQTPDGRIDLCAITTAGI